MTSSILATSLVLLLSPGNVERAPTSAQNARYGVPVR